MTLLDMLLARLQGVIDLGGPVIGLLLVLSVIAVAVVIWKLWQFHVLGIGRHGGIARARAALDAGRAGEAAQVLSGCRSHLAPVLSAAIGVDAGAKPRLIAMAEDRLTRVERGFRLLDSIAQVAPLLGLFGTVLGMIDAFQALQQAGDAVDPSALAGGIWVALLTTASGLAVAMPTTLALTWFESRAARERACADLALETAFHPMSQRSVPEIAPKASRLGVAHAT